MAEGGDTTKVGGISVDVEANIDPFIEAMDKFDGRVKSYANKSIKLQLDLEKNFSDKDRLVNVTAKWAAGTLTGLAQKLAARNYAVTITSVKVSQDALNTLRSTLNAVFDSYTGVIDVKARVTGVESAGGGPINLEGPVNIISGGSVTQGTSAATTRSATRASRPATGGAATATTAAPATSGKTKGTGGRKTAAQRRAEEEALARENEALKAQLEAAEAAQEKAENEELKRMLRSAQGRERLSGRTRYTTATITNIRQRLDASSGELAAFRPEWLQRIAARPQQLRAGGPLPNDVADALRTRLIELTGNRQLSKSRQTELRELRDLVTSLEDPYAMLSQRRPGEIYAEAGADAGIRRRRYKAGSRGRTGEGTIASDALHGRVARTEDAPRVRSEEAQAVWDFHKARRAMDFLHSINPDFKVQPGESYPRAFDRARAEAAEAGRAQMDTRAGVDWNQELLGGYQALTGQPRAQAAYVRAQRAAIKKRVGEGLTPRQAELAYRRKDRAAALLMPTSTARLLPEEQAQMLPVMASDQDVLDILTLNQLGQETKGVLQARSFAPTIGKKSGKSVQAIGPVPEAIERASTRSDRSTRTPIPWEGRGMYQTPRGTWMWEKTETERAKRVKGKMPVKRWLRHLASQPGAMRERWVQEELAKLGVTEDITSLRGEAPTAPVMPEVSAAGLSGPEMGRVTPTAPSARALPDTLEQRFLAGDISAGAEMFAKANAEQDQIEAGGRAQREAYERRVAQQEAEIADYYRRRYEAGESTNVPPMRAVGRKVEYAASVPGPRMRRKKRPGERNISFLPHTETRSTWEWDVLPPEDIVRPSPYVAPAPIPEVERTAFTSPMVEGVGEGPRPLTSNLDDQLINRGFRVTGKGNLKVRDIDPEGRMSKWRKARKAERAAYVAAYGLAGEPAAEAAPQAAEEAAAAAAPEGPKPNFGRTRRGGYIVNGKFASRESYEKAAEQFAELGDSGAQGTSGGGGGRRGKRTAAGGGGAGEVLHVHVDNFSDLNKMLTGETKGNGSLTRVFKAAMKTAEPRREEESAEQFMKRNNITPEEFGAMLERGALPASMAGGEGKKAKKLKRTRLGSSSFEMTEDAVGVFDPDDYDIQERRQAAKAARERDRMVSAADKKARAEDAAALGAAQAADDGARKQSEKEAARGQKQATRAREAAMRQYQGAIIQPPSREQRQRDYERVFAGVGVPDKKSVDASMGTYFRQLGLTYTPPRAPAQLGQRRDAAEQARERALASATRAEFPERAPSIAVGQLFSRAFGIKSRYQQAQEELNANRANLQTTMRQSAAEEVQYQRSKTNLRQLSEINITKRRAGELTEEDVRKQQTLVDIHKQHLEARKALTKQTEDDTKAVDASLKKVTAAAGPLEKIGNVALLFTGAKAFTLALGAASAGLGVVEKAGAKAVDQMLGFGATSTRVTNALADQTKALHGNATAAFAAAGMTAGLSNEAAAYVKNQTQATVVAKAGAAAQAETSDLFRSVVGVGTQPKGLYGGYGGLLNTAFLGSEMGGGKGFVETALGDLGAFRSASNAPYQTNQRISGMPAGLLTGTFNEQGATGATQELIERGNRARTAEVKYLNDLNSAYDRNLRYTGKQEEALRVMGDAAPADLKKFREAISTLTGDAKTYADRMANLGYVIRDSAGKVIEGADQYQTFWENAAAGKTRPTPESVYTQTSYQMRAQFQAQQSQYRYQMDNRIPGAWGLGLIQQPLLDLGGARGMAGQALRGVSAGRAGAIGAGFAGVQTERNDIMAQARANLESMVAKAQLQMQSVGNAQGATELQTSLTNVLNLSQQIAAVSKSISYISAKQQADEFANSIRLAKRALEDAKAMAGGVGSELGAIQRQQWQLGRQSTALSLALSQRQINFQVATAGFQAPGITSEERAARIKEAKIQADYAQRQLNIQKQQFALAGREFGIQTARAVTDAFKSLGLLQRGRDRSAELARLAATMENLQAKQNLEVAKLNEGLSQADNIFQTKLSAAATAAGTLQINLDEASKALTTWMQTLGVEFNIPGTGQGRGRGGTWGTPTEKETGAIVGGAKKEIDKLTKDTGKHLQTVNTQATKVQGSMVKTSAVVTNVLARYLGDVLTWFNQTFAAVTKSGQEWTTDSAGTRRPKGSRSGPQAASGALFTTTGKTSLTVGEAGNETVAVLRNPRGASASGFGGGGTTVNVIINNPSVRNDGDITAIAREVEKVMNRKASLIGLRSIG